MAITALLPNIKNEEVLKIIENEALLDNRPVTGIRKRSIAYFESLPESTRKAHESYGRFIHNLDL